MSKESVERWAFTKKELNNLELAKLAKREDEFIVYVYGNAVMVDRRGNCLNRYADGTRGVTKAHRECAEDTVELYKANEESADTWCDVITNEEGEFIHFDFVKHTMKKRYPH